MPLDPNCCSSDQEEIAEWYVMSKLPGDDARAFEEHLLICPNCATAVEDAEEYVQAIRAAARRLRVARGL
jgi:anti-sigma factor RsiW